MATFQKFYSFVEALAEKKHNLASDTLKVMLTNTAPNEATNTVKTDITELATANGYTAGGTTTAQVSSAQTLGTYKLVVTDVTFTASGGSIGPFRYAVIYNDTAASDELIGYSDLGSALIITDGNSLILDFNSSTGLLQLEPAEI